MEDKFLNRLPADDVLFDNAVEHIIGDMVIPDAIRIDDEERSAAANAQARGDTTLDAQEIVVIGEFAQFTRQAAIERLRLATRVTIVAHTEEEVAGVGCLAWRHRS